MVGDASPLLVCARFTLERASWTFGDTHGVMWRARLPRDAALDVVPSETVRPLPDIVAGEAGDFVSVNGGFYEDGPMGLVVSGGREVHPLSARGGSGVLIAAPAPARVVHRDSFRPDGVSAALQSIDRLVDGGRSLVTARADARSDARTAVALTPDAVWLVAAVEDGSVSAEGPTGVTLTRTVGHGLPLAAFAGWLADGLHATEALNLDGAVSTQLQARAGSATYAVLGERGTINAVVGR